MNLQELFKVEGKIAVVTGGSRGIGEMITAGFLANGVKVYITARKFVHFKQKPKSYLNITIKNVFQLQQTCQKKKGSINFVMKSNNMRHILIF
ncbi:MAG: hypothetical protein CM15mP127_07830 [Gammaproteobacteria bacterium]|nr:MAG: hypothetical protein CM15mP127_07830 [Gammaproteobacteria bacterium]